MILIIKNQTAGTLSYLSGSVTVNGNSNTTVSATYIYPISRDSGLINDCLTGTILINDGTVDYTTNEATTYLDQIATSVAGAVISLLGATTPNYAIMVGGKNPSGNAVLGSMDVNGKLNVNMNDSSGQNISSISDGNGKFALEVAQSATNFVFSSGNSSTSQLTASSIFTGSVDSVINQQSFSMLITSDQNGILTLNQFIDAAGLRLAQTLSFTIIAGQGFSRSGVINGNYFQVKFQNTGGSTTTTLNINTYYGTIPSSTQWNNDPTALMEINGSTVITGGVNGLLAVAGNTSSLSSDSGNPLKIGSVFNSTLPSPTTGQRVDSQSNQFGETTIQYRNKFSNLTGNATTQVKTGSGRLHGIMINNNTTGGTITIYDNTASSGTVIATFSIGSPSGGLLSTSGAPGPTMIGPLGLEFSTGLRVVTSGSGSNNITILYQ